MTGKTGEQGKRINRPKKYKKLQHSKTLRITFESVPKNQTLLELLTYWCETLPQKPTGTDNFNWKILADVNVSTLIRKKNFEIAIEV